MAVKTDRKAILARILTELNLVDTVGNVFQDLPNPQDTQEIRDAWLDLDATDIQYWYVVRTASPSMSSSGRGQGDVPPSSVRYHHTFDIHYYHGFRKDVTTTLFQDIVDDVLDHFKNQRGLGGFAVTDPLWLERADEVFLGDIYCHHAIFKVTIVALEQNLVNVKT